MQKIQCANDKRALFETSKVGEKAFMPAPNRRRLYADGSTIEPLVNLKMRTAKTIVAVFDAERQGYIFTRAK